MAAVERAREAAEARVGLAQELLPATLQEVFRSLARRGVAMRRLGEALRLRQEIVHPRDKPSGDAMFVGLEHVESGTGRRTGALALDLSQLTGRKARFHKGDIVYGYLRPYLNKVWVAEFDGVCSVDQYVYSVHRDIAIPGYVAWFLLSAEYLSRAPISTTPGQLPRIRLDEVAGTRFPVPPLDEQAKLVSSLDRKAEILTGVRDSAETEADAIRRLPSALLREAFGETP